MTDYLAKYATPGVAKFAAGGAMPGGMPAGGAPADPAAGGGEMMGAEGGAPMGAGTDPALAGADQGGQDDVVGQIMQLVQQYQQAPSQQIEHEGWMLVMQSMGGGGQEGAAGGEDPAAMGQAGAPGGGMPQGAPMPAGGGAPPAAPMPGAGGGSAFRRGGAVPKGVDMPKLEAPVAKRKAKF